MFQTTYQLLTFFDAVEEIQGRKKLQKMIHLLKSSGADFPFKYRYHHYGPYSSQLQYEMNQLVEQDFLQEKRENGAYTYKMTADGRKFKAMLETDGGLSFQLNQDVLEKLVKKSTPFLEMFSTYAFLIESGDTRGQAKEKAAQLKPHLVTFLDEAIDLYEEYIVH